MDGRKALEILKADPSLRTIPIIVLSTSRAQQDVVESYRLGISGFITKPVGLTGLADVLTKLDAFWFNIVTLPD